MSTTSPRQWTVMVYMAADNNLSDRCIDDLREMKMVGIHDNITIKVQVDRASKLGNSPARYTIHGCPAEGSSDPEGALKKDREPWSKHYNSGRKEPLQEFIAWCAEGRPDDQYMLVLWGHASPLDNVPIPEPPRRRRFSNQRRDRSRPRQRQDERPAFFNLCPDDFTHDGLTDIELREVLAEVCAPGGAIGRPIEILGLDACLMSMIELTYQVKDYAKYSLASQSLIPSTSWPYHWILAELNQKPTMSPRELCRVIVDKYIAYYADYDDVPVQLSACDLSRSEAVKNAVAGLASELKSGLEEDDLALRNAVLAAHFRAQPYYEEQYYDLYDFCYMLNDSCGEGFPAVRQACNEVMYEVADRPRKHFVLDSENKVGDFSETDLQFSYGTSIYFPWTSVSDRYQFLQFAAESGWHDFLRVYTDKIAKFERGSRDRAVKPENDPHEPPEQAEVAGLHA
jgi:Clostripain family